MQSTNDAPPRSAVYRALSLWELAKPIVDYVHDNDDPLQTFTFNLGLTCKMFWEMVKHYFVTPIDGHAIFSLLPEDVREKPFDEQGRWDGPDMLRPLKAEELDVFKKYQAPSNRMALHARRYHWKEDVVALAYLPQFSMFPPFNALEELKISWFPDKNVDLAMDAMSTLFQPNLKVLILQLWELPQWLLRPDFHKSVSERCPNLIQYSQFCLYDGDVDAMTANVTQYILTSCKKLRRIALEPIYPRDFRLWQALDELAELEAVELVLPGVETPPEIPPISPNLVILRLPPTRYSARFLDTTGFVTACRAETLRELTLSATEYELSCRVLPIIAQRWSSTLRVLDIYLMYGVPPEQRASMCDTFWAHVFACKHLVEFGVRCYHFDLKNSDILDIINAWPHLRRLELIEIFATGYVPLRQNEDIHIGRSALYQLVEAYPGLTWLSLPVDWDLPFIEPCRNDPRIPTCPNLLAWDWAFSKADDLTPVRQFLRRHFPRIRAMCGDEDETVVCQKLEIDPPKRIWRKRDWIKYAHFEPVL